MKINVAYQLADGQVIEVEVSSEVAAFLTESERDMKRLENIDERHFGLLHYTDQAWENLRELSSMYSAEDECLGTPDDIAEAEYEHYMKRLGRCRRAYRMLQEACTPTQWRRFILNRYHGLTIREIAQKEGCHYVTVAESILSVDKKVKKIFSVLS